MSKENIYDQQVNPLMRQILEICMAHKISMIADFGLDDDLHCTSALLDDEYMPSESQLDALDLLKPRHGVALAETVETLPGGNKKVTVRRIS